MSSEWHIIKEIPWGNDSGETHGGAFRNGKQKNNNMNILEMEYISGKWEVFGKHEFGISLPKRVERDTGKW